MVAEQRIEWLEKHLKELFVLHQQYKNKVLGDEVFNEFKYLTPLKLVFHKYVLQMYTKIIPKFFSHMYYVDLFAGSGLNKIKNYVVIGSPLIASICCSKPFEKMHFFENNPKMAKTLEKRLLNLGNEPDKFKVIDKDCNVEIDNILDDLKTSSTHSLIFIDPYAMEIKWETMEKILKLNSDVIFTFQTKLIARAWGSKSKDKFNEFYGDNSWKKAGGEQDLLKIYIDNILKNRENAIVKTVNIRGGSFYYDLIFITRKTRGGNPWMSGIIRGKKEIEKRSSDAVRLCLDILSGKQKQIKF